MWNVPNFLNPVSKTAFEDEKGRRSHWNGGLIMAYQALRGKSTPASLCTSNTLSRLGRPSRTGP